MKTLTTPVSGLLAGPALRIYSPRVVCIVGNLMVALGMMLSALATNPWQIIVTYSCLVGNTCMLMFRLYPYYISDIIQASVSA